jgi:hypothetical protein
MGSVDHDPPVTVPGTQEYYFADEQPTYAITGTWQGHKHDPTVSSTANPETFMCGVARVPEINASTEEDRGPWSVRLCTGSICVARRMELTSGPTPMITQPFDHILLAVEAKATKLEKDGVEYFMFDVRSWPSVFEDPNTTEISHPKSERNGSVAIQASAVQSVPRVGEYAQSLVDGVSGTLILSPQAGGHLVLVDFAL